MRRRVRSGAAALLAAILAAAPARAQQAAPRPAGMELYGFVMADAIYDATGINPTWIDAARPSQLPSFDGQYGEQGRFSFNVKQTRFGIKPHVPTSLGEVNAHFVFDLFGVGPDAGQTTFRLRKAFVSLGQFGFGQEDGAFMDMNVFPNIWDYWGPHGMVLFRNVQFRWTPVQGKRELYFTLERPGASGDEGDYANRVELEDVSARFPLPDVAAAYKHGGDWGYLRLAGIVRYIKWDDLGAQQFDLSGDAVGWGLSATSILNLGKRAVFRGQATYGEGIQNYMNDSPADVGPELTGDPLTPLTAKPLPIWAFSAFVDLNWTDQWTSSVGYSMTGTDNTEGQAADAFRLGRYAAANVLWSPVPNVIVGPEVQYISRANIEDGYDDGGFRFQFSAKYSFSNVIGGK